MRLPRWELNRLSAPGRGTSIENFSLWQIGNILDHHALQRSALLYLYADTTHQAPPPSQTLPRRPRRTLHSHVDSNERKPTPVATHPRQ